MNNQEELVMDADGKRIDIGIQTDELSDGRFFPFSAQQESRNNLKIVHRSIGTNIDNAE